MRSRAYSLVEAGLLDARDSSASGPPSRTVWERLAAFRDAPADVGAKIAAWAMQERGVVMSSPRTRAESRARQIVWVILQHLGLGHRRIAALCGLDRTVIRDGLHAGAADATIEAEAAQWAARYLKLLEVVRP